MHPQTYSPGLAAATTTGRALIAAGWIYDSTSPMADDTTIRTLLHPSGREIHARTDDGDELTDLTLTGLTLEQVAGAITGAGLAPAAVGGEVEPGDCTCWATSRNGCPAHALDKADAEEPDQTVLGAQIAFQRELRRLADDIVEHNLPVPTYSLRVGGCVETRADAQAWADFFGVEIKWGGTGGNIPVAEKDIKFGDGLYLHLAFQAPSENRPDDPEKVALAARVAELEAKLAEGGADR